MRKLFVATLASLLAQLTLAQPLHLHPKNPHIFLYKSKPFIIVGSGEHYGAVMNLDFDYKIYLQTMGREGMNTTRLFTGPHKEKMGAFGIQRNTMAMRGERYLCAWARTDVPGYSEGGNKFDLTKFDENYFARLKDFMQEADKNGVIVEVNLFSSFYGAMWPTSPFHPANNVNQLPDVPYKKVQTLDNGPYWAIQEAYVRKVVRELNGFDNFYFEIQNEPWADNGKQIGVWNDFIQRDMLKEPGNYWRNVLEPANEAALAWQKKIAAVIRDEEGKLSKKHLISQNYGNFKFSLPDVDPNVDILTFHYAHPEAVTLNQHWGKVVGFNETGFAGRGDDVYRRQAWRFMMSGGGLFNHLDYSFTVGREDGTDVTNEAPGGGSPKLRQQFRLLKDFLLGLDLVNLQPDNQVVSNAKGAFTYTLSNRRNEWVVYCEGMQPFTLALNLPKGNYTAEWRDTRIGTITKSEKLTVRTATTTIVSGESFAEVVVRLKKE